MVNELVNVERRSFDELKAILHNCARGNPETQNRDKHADFRAHLRGRVAWVEHVAPVRGARLRLAFERIVWD